MFYDFAILQFRSYYLGLLFLLFLLFFIFIVDTYFMIIVVIVKIAIPFPPLYSFFCQCQSTVCPKRKSRTSAVSSPLCSSLLQTVATFYCKWAIFCYSHFLSFPSFSYFLSFSLFSSFFFFLFLLISCHFLSFPLPSSSLSSSPGT